MTELTVKTDAHSEFRDITGMIAEKIPDNFTGLCQIYIPHTTASVTINENADPDVKHDMISFLDKLVPWNEKMFRHYEGNSAAHIKSSLMGFSETVPVVNGRLQLGTWQSIYFCEFDGPRTRKAYLTFISG